MRVWALIEQTALDRDAAVNDESLARDPARIVGKEERGGTGDVVRSTESIERIRSRDLALVGADERRGELCLDHGRGDRIDPDGGGQARARARASSAAGPPCSLRMLPNPGAPGG